MKQLLHGLCLVLPGGYFLYAGISKAGSRKLFEQQISSYQLLPQEWIPLVAASLPVYEILLAGLLACKATRRTGLAGMGALLIAFSGAIVSAMVKGLEITCGCAGEGGFSLEAALVRNLVLLAMIVWCHHHERTS